jgi:hypothetical protein
VPGSDTDTRRMANSKGDSKSVFALDTPGIYR